MKLAREACCTTPCFFGFTPLLGSDGCLIPEPVIRLRLLGHYREFVSLRIHGGACDVADNIVHDEAAILELSSAAHTDLMEMHRQVFDDLSI